MKVLGGCFFLCVCVCLLCLFKESICMCYLNTYNTYFLMKFPVI